jgi:hypothetical protein
VFSTPADINTARGRHYDSLSACDPLVERGDPAPDASVTTVLAMTHAATVSAPVTARANEGFATPCAHSSKRRSQVAAAPEVGTISVRGLCAIEQFTILVSRIVPVVA